MVKVHEKCRKAHPLLMFIYDWRKIQLIFSSFLIFNIKINKMEIQVERILYQSIIIEESIY